MTVEIHTLSLRIDSLETRAAAGDLERLREASEGASAATSGLQKATGLYQDALGKLGIPTSIAQIIHISDEYAKFTGQLRMATQSSAEYAQAYDNVRRIANSGATELSATGMLYARIATSTRELALSQQQVAGIAEAVNLGIAASGATAAESASAIGALSSALASGAVSADQFNTINRSAPALMAAMADGVGVSVEALGKMASAGTLTASVIAGTLPSSLDSLRDSASSVQTVGDAFTLLGNSVTEFVGKNAESSGVVEGLIKGIGLLAENLGLLLGVSLSMTASKFGSWAASAAVHAYEGAVANRLLLTSTLATAEANAAATASASVLATARVAELRAAVLAAEANVALAITTNGLVPALMREAAATEAAALAARQLAAAQTAASVAGGVARGVIGLVGGPLGAVVLALGLAATAWATWGRAAKESSEQGAETFEQAQKRVIAGLDKEIAKNEKLIQLKKQGVTPAEAEKMEPVNAQLALASGRLSAINDRAGEFKNSGSAEIIFARKQVMRDIADLVEKIKLRQKTEAELAKLPDLTVKIVTPKGDKAPAPSPTPLVNRYEHAAADALREAEANEKLVATFGMSKAAIEELELTRLKSLLAPKEQIKLNVAEAASLKQLIAAKERSAQAGAELAQREAEAAQATAQAAAQEAEAKKLADAWNASAQGIEKSLGDALKNGFGEGKNALKSYLDKMKNDFKDTILRPIIAPISAGVASLMNPGAAQAQEFGTATGGGNALIGAVKMANSFYKMANAGFAQVGGQVTNMVQSGVNFLGGGPASGVMGPTVSGGNIANGALAEGAGTAASYVAGMAAGKMFGSAISGQYGVAGHGSAVVNIGTAIGAIWGPLGAAIGGALGGVVNRAFGRGNKEVVGQGLRGDFSASGLTGESYVKTHQDGGWFRSDKDETKTTALDRASSTALNEGFAGLKTALADAAKNLGVGDDTLKNYSKKFDIALTGDASKNQEAISTFFAGVGNEIADKLIPNLAAFSKGNETASATLERLSSHFQITNQLAGLLGKTVEQAFGAVGMASAAAREKLIEYAGGAAALSSQTAFFAQNYLDQAERLAPVSKALDAAMASLGLSGVTTRTQFKNELLKLDLKQDGDAKQYAAMMALQEAFAQVHPAVNTQQGIDKASEALVTAYQGQSEALKNTIDGLKNFRASIASFKDSLLLGNLSALTPVQKLAEAKHQYERTLARAMGGDGAARAQLQAAATSYLTANQVANASSPAYLADAARVQADLSALAASAGVQLSEAQQQQQALDKQVGSLVTLNKTAVGIHKAIADLGAALRAGGQPDVTRGVSLAPDGGFSSPALASFGAAAQLDDVQIDAPAAAAMQRYFSAASGPGGANSDALVAEIKGLREEIRQLRADQDEQTGAIINSNYDANERAAEKVSAGSLDAAKSAAWAAQSKASIQ